MYKNIRHTEHYFFAWVFSLLTGGLLAVELSCCDCVEVKVSRGIVPSPQRDSNPCPLITVALNSQYLNVCQRKLCTLIINQTVHMLHYDSADTVSLYRKEISKHNLTYFQ
jgi:hypothetical protein